MPLEVLERELRALPPEAWDPPLPPPSPWPAAAPPAAPARRRLTLRPLAAALAGLALLATGVGAGLLASGGGDDPGPVRVELAPVDGRGDGAAGLVRLEPRPGGRAAVELSGLPPSDGRSFYELWLLGADGRLVSLGAVRVPDSGRAGLEVDLPVDPARFEYLDVSREPADGDPAHSSISVLRGPTT
jgi:anti-sigma-K factor RskA